MLCATRYIKNVKKVKSLVPDAFPETEPIDGFASVYPYDVLNNFHNLSPADLTKYPKLADVGRLLREKQPAVAEPRGIIFSDPPFKGTLHLAQLTFQTGATTSVTISDASVATILQYTQLALPVISQYCKQYGDNSLAVSPQIMKMIVQTPNGKYNDDNLQSWVRGLLLSLGPNAVTNSCIVVFNPPGLINTDGDISKNILGYHNEVIVPVGTLLHCRAFWALHSAS